MENKSDSRAKKDENQLDLFSSQNSIQKKYQSWNDHKLTFPYKKGAITLPRTPTNRAFVNKVEQLQRTGSQEISSPSKYKTNLRDNFKKLSKMLIKLDVNKDIIVKLKKLTAKSNEFNNIFNILNTIQTISKDILLLKIFKGYNFSQILIHERGKSIVDNYFFSSLGKLSLESAPIQSFNAYFNLIKKSKNKQFNSSSSNMPLIKSIGTFLAKDFNLKNHSIILILSRNDFLPSTKDEINEFYQFSKTLRPLFELLFLQSLNDERINNIVMVLNHFPFCVAIIDEYDNLIYKNQSFNVTQFHDNINDYLSLSLGGNKKIFIDLQKNKAIQSELHHFQRISLLGELLNTLQHELNNPLFGINLTAGTINREGQTEEVSEMLNNISEYALRCQNIIKNFSNLYSDNETFADINIKELIPEVLKLTKSETKQIEKKIVYINNSNKKSLIVHTNPTWITQILFNLIINASQAMKNQSKPTINIFVNKNEILSTIEIAVSDNGPGIPLKIEQEILKPFFTTKTHGTGLGLSICCRLAEKLKSNISFKNNSPMKGATFSLNLKIS